MSSAPRPARCVQLRLLRGLLRTPESVLDEIAATVGPVCELGAGPLRVIVLGAPGAIRELLMQPPERFRWDHPLSPFPFAVGKTTMLASAGDEHRTRRGAVQGAFSRRRLDRWIPMIVTETDAALDRLVAAAVDGSVDLYPWGRRLTLETVVRTLFGERLVDRVGEIDAAFGRIQDHLGSPLWRQLPHPLSSRARSAVRRDRERLDAIIDEEIAAVRRAPEHDPFDVLATLVADGELTDEEIRDQVKTLIGAGYDTTASSLAWMWWEAASCPGLWPRLRDEAEQAFACGTDIVLSSLPLAAHTVRETLRLHPASGIAPRITREAMTINGVAIRRGTIVAWSPYLAGRHPASWSDPLRFNPGRFESDDPEARAAAELAWVPFGRGPRSCIGFALAQMELTLILARTAQRVDLVPICRTIPAAEGLVVSRPRGGVPMTVVRAAFTSGPQGTC